MRENMAHLEDYTEDDDLMVAQAARILIEAKDAYETEELTLEEYREIIKNVLDLEKLNGLSMQLERKQRIQQIFEMMRELLGAVTLL